MATTLAASAPHSFPLPLLQQAPRVRPPRFLKGQPRDVNLPQPEGPVPETERRKVWAQGRWRSRNSNSVVDRQKVLTQQLGKAVARKTHGCSIYAYYHQLTNQVVYSTSRVMQEGQIMPQLVFHGKKTVPAGIRRDMWRPYFSIHFPETDNGKRLGLITYQQLRELTMRRQFSPDPESMICTQEDIDEVLRQAGSPNRIRRLYRSDHGKMRRLQLPVLGEKLPQRLRAKKLMAQKATSVADAAFILSNVVPRLPLWKNMNAELDLAHKTAEQLKLVGHRAGRTLAYKRGKEAETEAELESRAEHMSNINSSAGNMPLDHSVAKFIALEHDGAISGAENKVVDMADTPNQSMTEAVRASEGVMVLWADIRDGLYARAWPGGVVHSEMQPFALQKAESSRYVTQEYANEEGKTILERVRESRIHATGKNVHVHGQHRLRTAQQPNGPIRPHDVINPLNEARTQKLALDHEKDYLAGLVMQIDGVNGVVDQPFPRLPAPTTADGALTAISPREDIAATTLAIADTTTPTNPSLAALHNADPDAYAVAQAFRIHRREQVRMAPHLPRMKEELAQLQSRLRGSKSPQPTAMKKAAHTKIGINRTEKALKELELAALETLAEKRRQRAGADQETQVQPEATGGLLATIKGWFGR